MKLTDLFETKIKILSEKETKDGSMKILAPFIQTGRKNKNGRLYGYDLIHREIARLQPSIKAGAMISSADHPFTPHTSLANASHIITKLELDKNGKGWMEATILPNEKGKNVMTIVKAGGQLGLSIRGLGDVSPSGTVEKNYKLLGCDIVTSPAEPTATFDKSNICESLEFEEDNPEDLEEEIINLEKESFLNAVENGFQGTQSEWEEIHGGDLRKMVGLKEEDGKTVVEKLTEEAINARVLSFYNEAVASDYKGTFDEWKKEFPKIVETASESIRISEKKEPKKPFKARISWSEAVASGFTGTIDKWKKKYPDFELILPEPTQKPIVETLGQEAQRIFEG